jgi:hypothetical protein
MPIPKSQLDRIIDSVERVLLANKERMRADFNNRDCNDPIDPLKAPKQPPFSDGAPQRIHGQPDQVASPWGEKPKVPITIEHI